MGGPGNPAVGVLAVCADGVVLALAVGVPQPARVFVVVIERRVGELLMVEPEPLAPRLEMKFADEIGVVAGLAEFARQRVRRVPITPLHADHSLRGGCHAAQQTTPGRIATGAFRVAATESCAAPG